MAGDVQAFRLRVARSPGEAQEPASARRGRTGADPDAEAVLKAVARGAAGRHRTLDGKTTGEDTKIRCSFPALSYVGPFYI